MKVGRILLVGTLDIIVLIALIVFGAMAIVAFTDSEPEIVGELQVFPWPITIFSFFATWTIGLSPALAIRFQFLCRPIEKRWIAATYSGTLFVFGTFAFILFGEENPSTPIMLAVVSFFILLKGRRKTTPPPMPRRS